MAQQSLSEHLFADIDAGLLPAALPSTEDAGIQISFFDQWTVPTSASAAFSWVCLNDASTATA